MDWINKGTSIEMPKEIFKSIHGNVYETPLSLFKNLNDEFNFIYDLACEANNAKCKKFLSSERVNSLKVNWSKLGEGWLWLNPPYSPLKPWIEKSQLENSRGAKIVVLCPPILSTRYFQKHLPSEIRFILGRVPYILDGVEMKANTHDSCLLIYDTKIRQPKITYIDRDILIRGKQ